MRVSAFRPVCTRALCPEIEPVPSQHPETRVDSCSEAFTYEIMACIPTAKPILSVPSELHPEAGSLCGHAGMECLVPAPGCPGWIRSTATVSDYEDNQDWSHTFWFSRGRQPEFLSVSCKGVIRRVMSNNPLVWSLMCYEIWAAQVKSWIPNAFRSFSIFFN